MGQIDNYDLGVTVGRIENKVDTVITSLGTFKRDIDNEIALHDSHIQKLLNEQAERKGANHVWLAVYSFVAIGFWKLIEHAPSLFK